MNGYMFEVFIETKGREDSQGVWLGFPTDLNAVEQCFLRLGVNWRDEAKWRIRCYNSSYALDMRHFMQNESLNALNFFAHRLCAMSEKDMDKFLLATLYQPMHVESLTEMIKLTFDMDGYDYFATILTEQALGKHWFRKQMAGENRDDFHPLLERFLDFKGLGAAVSRQYGLLTEKGYICENDQDFTCSYCGTDAEIPDAFKIYLDKI